MTIDAWRIPEGAGAISVNVTFHNPSNSSYYVLRDAWGESIGARLVDLTTGTNQIGWSVRDLCDCSNVDYNVTMAELLLVPAHGSASVHLSNWTFHHGAALAGHDYLVVVDYRTYWYNFDGVGVPVLRAGLSASQWLA